MEDIMRMFGSEVKQSYSVARARIDKRLGFLRKVYGILSVQLLFTFAVATVFKWSSLITYIVQTNHWLVFAGIIGSLGLCVALQAYKNEYPTNYMLLSAFTAVEACLVGTVVTYYKVESILDAFLLTMIVTICLTAYTFQSRMDFDRFGAGIFSLLGILVSFMFMQLFFPTPGMDRLLSVGIAVLYCMYIIYDTGLIMERLTPEEYIVAPTILYLDMVALFLRLLKLRGEREKRND
uniref:Protein lifeguard 4-like n=1 Tax=Crassostrea virginica TaxID=6565 RepID=A0A8B8BJ24_CRAVI|nr:protein lifeguard 4-like [Crassostrea virginica]XP_022302834.1 protein lifeguard 4-like [Crassostrea virginica]|mmetsp:Transcript_29588/g.47278  ORF Transcript_29588/g.47278 Transcript_29588/m.47278 type:complete len:236 (+) Transcript_29588:117-824(+)